jgi:hypothetical protein
MSISLTKSAFLTDDQTSILSIAYQPTQASFLFYGWPKKHFVKQPWTEVIKANDNHCH